MFMKSVVLTPGSETLLVKIGYRLSSHGTVWDSTSGIWDSIKLMLMNMRITPTHLKSEIKLNIP